MSLQQIMKNYISLYSITILAFYRIMYRLHIDNLKNSLNIYNIWPLKHLSYWLNYFFWIFLALNLIGSFNSSLFCCYRLSFIGIMTYFWGGFSVYFQDSKRFDLFCYNYKQTANNLSALTVLIITSIRVEPLQKNYNNWFKISIHTLTNIYPRRKQPTQFNIRLAK